MASGSGWLDYRLINRFLSQEVIKFVGHQWLVRICDKAIVEGSVTSGMGAGWDKPDHGGSASSMCRHMA